MVGINKSKLGGQASGDRKPKIIKSNVKPGSKTSVVKSKVSGTVAKKPPVIKTKTGAESLAAMQAKLAQDKEAIAKKQEELLHSKTHQDLINAAYKAAEKLGIAPWVLLRAAGWGHFTDDRGKRYDGPAIDKLEGLDEAQKKALKEVLGI